MSGDWIKMRGNLWDDPRVSRIVDMTESSEAAVIGALYWLWATADQHSADGILYGLTTRAIDRKTGVQGFGDALLAIGWLADHPDGVRVVNFEEHNGDSAKKRLETAKRVAKHRALTSGDEGAIKGAAVERALIPIDVREQIIARDGRACVYCRRPEGQFSQMETRRYGVLQIDHVIPLDQGGSDHPSNLVCACGSCNNIKSNRTPDECGFIWPEIDGKRAGNTNALPIEHECVSRALPREEKRREEKEKDPPKPPKGADFEPEGFAAFWKSWPKSTRKGGRDKCAGLWREKRLEGLASEILVHVEAMAASKDWTKEAGQYVPAPIVYLRSRAWSGADLDCQPDRAFEGAI